MGMELVIDRVHIVPMGMANAYRIPQRSTSCINGIYPYS
jgi:hypothetical protein